MSEESVGIDKLGVPDPIGLKPQNPSVLDSQANRFLNWLPLSQQMAEQKKVLSEIDAEKYKQIYTPDYEKKEITQHSERNRQILLWAINKGINIPLQYCYQDSYGSISTDALVADLFDEKQVQELQGALIMALPIARSQRDIDFKNVVAFGGLFYSQAPVDKDADFLFGLLIRHYPGFPLTLGFKEPGITPGVLRKNIRGAMHILPYGEEGGEAKIVPGKEKETIMMMSSDILALLDYFDAHPQTMGYPRFILNGTSGKMGRFAEKYLGAQTVKINEKLQRVMHTYRDPVGATLSPRPPRDAVAVFLTEQGLKANRDKIANLLTRMGKSRSEQPLAAQLKEMRIEAIDSIAPQIDFIQMYKNGQSKPASS
jgi:hypothetical protein